MTNIYTVIIINTYLAFTMCRQCLKHFTDSKPFNSDHYVSAIAGFHFIDKKKPRHKAFKDSSQDHTTVKLGFELSSLTSVLMFFSTITT